jgi:multicomponent Na+:H+ antiporter subunit F
MNDGAFNVVELAPVVAMGMIGLSMFLTFVRLVLGPTLPDRVVALDLMGVLAVGMLAAYDVAANQPVLLDPAAVLALVGFLGTVAFARYLERRGHDE